MAPRVLLLARYQAYRTGDVAEAARRLQVELTLGTDRCHVLAEPWPDAVLTLDFDDEAACTAAVRAAHAERPFAAVLGTCEVTSALSSVVGLALGLRVNPVDATRIAQDKARLRTTLTLAGVPTPRHTLHGLDDDALVIAAAVSTWPVVVKPLLLSGSRGVMRADDAADLASKLQRLRAILYEPDVRMHGNPGHRQVLVEEFVPGPEVALEGMLRDGRLEVLALFDKPDPLDGPFFEETLYVTPSRHAAAVQAAVLDVVQRACEAMGLRHGPVHAEARVAPAGPVLLECAARSIGGLCARTLRFGTGRSLDEVVLEGALGLSTTSPPRERQAAGVMMLPIPRAGILRNVDGVDRALRVPGVVDVVISVKLLEELVPLPEGKSYLGFVFARGALPADVERSLRAAYGALRFTIGRKLPIAGTLPALP